MNTEMKKQIIQAVKDLKKREKEKEAEQDMIYEDLVMANSSFKKGKKRKLALLKRLKRPKKAPKKAMSEDVKKARSFNRLVFLMVGERGFEPPAPWSQTRCATRLRHSPTN